MKHYIINLSTMQRKKLEKLETAYKSFVFGNMGHLTTLAMYKIPAMLAGKEYKIRVDVVNSEIPLLLIRMSMAKSILEQMKSKSLEGVPKYSKPQQGICACTYTPILGKHTRRQESSE